MKCIVWLDEPTATDPNLVGGKAATLARLRQAGFPVPNGFCVTTAAHRRFLEYAQLLPEVAKTSQMDDESVWRDHGVRMRHRLMSASFDPSLIDALDSALRRLGPNRPVAVRTSAVAEDGDLASFAGQGETYLGVCGLDAVSQALKASWASFWSDRAIAYRRQHQIAFDGDVALLVQEMVPTDVAGVAFSVDPLQRREVVVVEAMPGLGDQVTAGVATPERYELSRPALVPEGVSSDSRLLDDESLQKLGGLVLAIESTIGTPLDVEWGRVADRWYVLQARPITATGTCDVFDERDGNCCWTSGFLDERFPEPVSPLGWSVLRPAIEEFAFREPLRFLGHPQADALPVTRLRRGHPYVNVAILQSFYKLLPDWLLPEDARRYFPGGDVSIRREATYPASIFDLRMWRATLGAFFHEPAPWSPWHNYRLWERFRPRYDRVVAEVEAEIARLGDEVPLARLRALLRRLEAANADLLRIHRWSLTHADVLYSLFRRLGRFWFGPERGPVICAGLVSDLGDQSFEMNEALRTLAGRLRELPDLIRVAAAVTSLDEFRARASAAGATDLASDLDEFLERFGHRSFSLDIRHPSFAAAPTQVLRLLGRLAESSSPERLLPRYDAAIAEARRLLTTSLVDRSLPLRRLIFEQALRLTREYVRLREDQRFSWQKGIATLRALYLRFGEWLCRSGVTDSADDVFFLTVDEIEGIVDRAIAREGESSHRRLDDLATARETAVVGASPRDGDEGMRRIVRERRARYERLRDEFQAAPWASYPPFLQGDRPIDHGDRDRTAQRLVGQPVSPGVARGRARVILSPSVVAEIGAGDVLVTRGADPGWTPIFGTIAGLIMESGGQLSHGSVVAREYGVPAVVGIPGVTELLRDGDEVVVDGSAGTVTIVGDRATE